MIVFLLCALLCAFPVIAQDTKADGLDAPLGQNAESVETDAIPLDVEVLPLLESLSYRDEGFKQYAQAVEDDNKARANGKPREWLIYRYAAKKGDTLRLIASICCIREETLATINSIASIREEITGRTLLLPAFNAVFIATEPQSAFETLIANDTSLEEYVAKSQNLCYNVDGRFFVVADGAKISPTARLFFLDESYQMPVEGAYLSSRYGMRISPISGKRLFHNGIDLAVAEGTAVHPCKSGTVVHCALGDAVFGNYVVLSHTGGVTSLYAHLSRITTQEGATVGTANTIGRVGHTGMATGPHLHFEIKTDGKSIDPRTVLGG